MPEEIDQRIDLASQRFGELPRWALERFDRADVDSLDRWSRRFLHAGRLEAIFDDETSHPVEPGSRADGALRQDVGMRR